MADTMDTPATDYLRHRLRRFSTAIEETREHFSRLSPFGRYPASAPYYERCGILQLFDSLDADPKVRADLFEEYQRIERDLRRLEGEQNAVYRHCLREELHTRLDTYSAAVCHANLGCETVESDNGLFCRDRIVVLIRELENDHDLTGAKHLLRMLDANLFPPDTGSDRVLSGSDIGAAGSILHYNRRDLIEG